MSTEPDPPQLRFKEKLVDDNLKRIGKIEGYEFFQAIGMEEPFRYRNKAQYPVGTAKDGSIVMGFYAGRTHSIISCTDCKIGAVENQYILAVIKSWMELNGIAPYDEQTGRGLVRHVLIPCRQQARNVARPDLPMLWNIMLVTTMTGCKNMARHW